MCLALGHNAVTPVSLEPAAPRKVIEYDKEMPQSQTAYQPTTPYEEETQNTQSHHN